MMEDRQMRKRLEQALDVYHKRITEAKDSFDILKAQREFFHLRNGYITTKDPLEKTSIFTTNKNRYIHFWSPKEMGRVFGVRNYKDLMTVKDYLTTSMDTELFMDGVAEGIRERQEMEQKYIKELEDKKKRSGEPGGHVTEEAMNALAGK